MLWLQQLEKLAEAAAASASPLKLLTNTEIASPLVGSSVYKFCAVRYWKFAVGSSGAALMYAYFPEMHIGGLCTQRNKRINGTAFWRGCSWKVSTPPGVGWSAGLTTYKVDGSVDMDFEIKPLAELMQSLRATDALDILACF